MFICAHVLKCLCVMAYMKPLYSGMLAKLRQIKLNAKNDKFQFYHSFPSARTKENIN